MFYNSSENCPWNNCWVLTDVNAYSKYCQEALPRHCQHLSVNMFRSCLPTTVKSSQIMWSDAITQLLSSHNTPGQSRFLSGCCHPGHSSVLVVTWRKSQCNLASTAAKHNLYNSSHNQHAHYSVLWPWIAGNPCNTWELQHRVPVNKNYPAVLSK